MIGLWGTSPMSNVEATLYEEARRPDWYLFHCLLECTSTRSSTLSLVLVFVIVRVHTPLLFLALPFLSFPFLSLSHLLTE